MHVMVVHARYRQYGGEDAAVDTERALLSAAGLRLSSHIVSNDDLPPEGGIATGINAIWSRPARRRLHAQLLRDKPDIVHVHNSFPALSASVYAAAHDAGVPVIQSLHNYRLLCTAGTLLRRGQPCTRCVGAPLPWAGIFLRCYRDAHGPSLAAAGHAFVSRRMGGHVARYIALSEHARDQFVAGGLPAAKVIVKPNLVWDPGVPGNPARQGFLYAGRLSPEKGIDTLLSAFTEASGRRPGMTLSIAGDGPLAELVRAAAAADPAIRWLRHIPRSELSALMHRSALLVHPSHAFEHFPMAVAEALAHGLPVLGGSRGAMPELVQDNISGWLLPPGDIAAWRDALCRAQHDADRLREAGAAARLDFEQRLAPGIVLQRQLALYEDVVAEYGKGAAQ